MPRSIRRTSSVMSTTSVRMPREDWKKSWSTIDPAMPIETPPRERYDLPRISATASAARTKSSSLRSTSSGIEASVESWTSRP
jgi:hypothetical protein